MEKTSKIKSDGIMDIKISNGYFVHSLLSMHPNESATIEFTDDSVKLISSNSDREIAVPYTDRLKLLRDQFSGFIDEGFRFEVHNLKDKISLMSNEDDVSIRLLNE